MATLIVSYYAGVQNGVPKGASGTELVTTNAPLGAGVQATQNSGAPVAMLISSAAHYFRASPAGENAVAIGTGAYLPANTPVFVGLNAGEQITAVEA